jgi:hypothetical protein
LGEATLAKIKSGALSFVAPGETEYEVEYEPEADDLEVGTVEYEDEGQGGEVEPADEGDVGSGEAE